MRCPDGKPLTAEERAEIEKFGDFLRDVQAGMTEQAAYALHYGETIFDVTKKASEQP